MRISNITHNYTTPIYKNSYNTTPESAQETETTGSLGVRTAGMGAAELTSRISFGSLVEEEKHAKQRYLRIDVLRALIQSPNRLKETKGYDQLFHMIKEITADDRSNADVLINALQDPDFKLIDLPLHVEGHQIGSLEDSKYDKYRKPSDIDVLSDDGFWQVFYLESLLELDPDNIEADVVNLYQYIHNIKQRQAMKSIAPYYSKIKDETQKQDIIGMISRLDEHSARMGMSIGEAVEHLSQGKPGRFEVIKSYFNGKIPEDIAWFLVRSPNTSLVDKIYKLPLEEYTSTPEKTDNLKMIFNRYYIEDYDFNKDVTAAMAQIIKEAFEQENPLEYAALEMKKLAES